VIDEADLARLVREQARPGDIFVCLGAGTISPGPMRCRQS
jgi:UDP-N-acetylmuramate--alanine ligase